MVSICNSYLCKLCIAQYLHYLCSRKVKQSNIMLMNINIINDIRQYFPTQPVKKAWLFGSFSRGEEMSKSDVDILVEFDRSGKPVTLLTYARQNKYIYDDKKNRDDWYYERIRHYYGDVRSSRLACQPFDLFLSHAVVFHYWRVFI